jgi:SAM-dependent methyltransferase
MSIGGDHPGDSVLDACSKVEIGRQLLFHRRLRQVMGGLVPEHPDFSQVQTVLDIACGAGAWARDMARTYPHLHVTGIDRDQRCIDAATALAWQDQIPNVTFAVHDMEHLCTDDIQIPSSGFDLVNLALFQSWSLVGNYPALLSDLGSLCCPDGMLRWTEYDMPITTSAALTELTAHLAHAVSLSGQPGPLCEHRSSVIHLMGAWLRQAGFEEIRHHATLIDVSAGAASYACFLRQSWVIAQQARTLLLKRGILTKQAAAELLRRLRHEIQERHFYGVCLVVTVRGKRGHAAQPEEGKAACTQEARREMA